MGKVGYAPVPGGNGEHATGYVKAIAAGSNNEEAAYLFCNGRPRRSFRWCASCCLTRCAIPIASSHYTSPLYRDLWPSAKDYLINLCNAANGGGDRSLHARLAGFRPVMDRMCTSVWGGEDPQAALTKAAAEWDATNQRLGIDVQKAAYEQFKQLPGSYADHTIEKLGQAVKLD